MTSDNNGPDERRLFRELDGYLADSQHLGYGFDVEAGLDRLKSALNDRATEAGTAEGTVEPEKTIADSAAAATSQTEGRSRWGRQVIKGSNREVTREDLAAMTTPTEFGAALRKMRDAAGLSIRRLEQKASAQSNGAARRFVDLSKNLIEDMEKGRRLEGSRIAGESDNRLEVYLWCCDVVREDMPAWLETRRRVLLESPVAPEPAPETEAPLRPAVTTALRRDIRTFLGRDVELRRILAAADAGASIYTIDGMPGVGKTALATHAAHLLSDRFLDGRYFVELHAHTPGRAVADSTDVLAGLLIGLGVDIHYLPDTLEGRRDLWRDRLSGKRVLLVLDDARDAEQIEPLLPGTAECLVLVTSRRRLIIPDCALVMALDILEPEPAAELFTTLAHRVAVDAEDREAVARIVQMCGYLPLAITLLAGRLARHPRWRKIAELVDGFGAATNRLGELDAGTRVVRAASDLLYRDLPPAHQLLFRKLGLYPGSDIDAHAAAALTGLDVATARWDLESLYTDHLLDEPAVGRYRLHDLLREYARTLADAELGSEQAEAQLLDYYEHTAAAADRWLARCTRPDSEISTGSRTFDNEIQALEWMRLERDNLLACLDHAANRQPARIVALTGVLAGLLDRDGPWTLAFRLHQRAIVAARGLDDRFGQAGALNDLGAVHWRAGDYEGAMDRLGSALTLYLDLGDRLGEANVLNSLGNVHEGTGDYAGAAELHRRALARYRELDDPLGEANALNSLGNVHEETGDYTEAAELHRRAFELYQMQGNQLGQANALNNLGIVRTRTGMSVQAMDLLQQALVLYRELGNLLGEANALNNLGIVRTRTSSHGEAVDLHGQALALYRQLGNRAGEANALNNLGIVRTRTGLYGEAVDLHRQALVLFRQLGNRVGEASALNNLGIVRTRTGRYPEAIDLHRQALALFDLLGNRPAATEVLIDIGTLLLETGQARTALGTFTEALELAHDIGLETEQARALEWITRCRAAMGETDSIEEFRVYELKEAIAIFTR
ncbi:ATP-binding protein [Nocardia alni]|uniref:ATP-binding protein n=1 Tax=Nocardia alni TaxID=2815723 RepID=UPI001C23B538|nr:tetratricopeptide repeat protein [Nocardia alni]